MKFHDELRAEVEIANNRFILNNYGIEHFAQTSQRDIKEIVDVVDADVQFGSAVAGSVIEHLQYNKKKLVERLDEEGRVQVASSLDGEKLIFVEAAEGGYVVELVRIEPTAKQVKDFGFKS